MASGVMANTATFTLDVVVSLFDLQLMVKILRSEGQELMMNEKGVEIHNSEPTYEHPIKCPFLF